jgi:hypothetical protein
VIPLRTPAGLAIVMEPMLEWESWAMIGGGIWRPPALVVGRERYQQLVFSLTVKPGMLETDPGPLDAPVP